MKGHPAGIRLPALLLLLSLRVASGEEAAAPAPSGAGTRSERLSRWFEMQMATIYARYRYVETSAGATTAKQTQHKESFKGRFKFDRLGRFSLNAGVFSGRSFISTWNNTGWGTGDAQSNLALKQLYLSAVPLNGVEIQYGGLYILRGESTEITTYDDDGYFLGERVSIRQPRRMFFDEISVTCGYLGDANTPNINKRFHRLKQFNYRHFLAAKKLGTRVAMSADYTYQAGRETLRQAIKVSAPELRVVDFLRFENYQRMDINPDFGFALYGEKSLAKRLTAGGGCARVDPLYGGLNADRFGSGNRLFLMGAFHLTPEFSFLAYVTRAVAIHVPVTQRTRLDLVLSYNLLKSLQRAGLF